MDNGTSTGGRGKTTGKKSVPGSRRVWSTREEKVLIQAFKDIVSQGWKSDNGFRTGFLTKLEEAIKKEFPQTDIIAHPNITSKMTTWKKHYGSIVTAHLTTGVGFNCTTNQLEVNDDQWIEVVKKDPTMRGMRYKEWPLYPDWVEIFGKDRATGEKAEDVTDMSSKMNNFKPETQSTATNEFNGENYVDLDPQDTTNNIKNANEEQEEDSTAYTTKSAPPMRMSGKKRKGKSESSEPSTSMILSEFCRATGERLETIAQRIGYDRDLGTARKRLFDDLKIIPGLTIRDRINVAKMIGSNTESLEMWIGLPDDARAVYVMDMLSVDGI